MKKMKKSIQIIILLIAIGFNSFAQTVDLQKGLVAYYPFNGNANDESGNGNNGTVYGASLVTDRGGKSNNAYSFDGYNDYIKINDNNTIRPSNISISIWVNLLKKNEKYKILGKLKYANASKEQYALGVTKDNFFIFYIKRNSNCQPGKGWVSVKSKTKYMTNNWYFLTTTYDGKNLKLFINGNLENSIYLNGGIDNCSGGNLSIGRWWQNDNQRYKGKLDDIRIYNRALNEAEIQALYSGNTNTITNETGTFTDSRDGKTYKTVKIGNQVWMAENLAYKANNGCWAYDNNQSNVSKYGYLYNFEKANNVCPSGWHLPSDKEWEQLVEYTNKISGPFKKIINGWDIIGNFLRAKSGWNENNGNDYFGFAGLPGGIGSDYQGGYFGDIGYDGFWWSSTESSDTRALYRSLHSSYEYLISDRSDDKNDRMSVRCIKD